MSLFSSTSEATMPIASTTVTFSYPLGIDRTFSVEKINDTAYITFPPHRVDLSQFNQCKALIDGESNKGYASAVELADSIIEQAFLGHVDLKIFCSSVHQPSIHIHPIVKQLSEYSAIPMSYTQMAGIDIDSFANLYVSRPGQGPIAQTTSMDLSPVYIGTFSEIVKEKMIWNGDTSKMLPNGYDNPGVEILYATEFIDEYGISAPHPLPVPGNNGVWISPRKIWGIMLVLYSPVAHRYRVPIGLPDKEQFHDIWTYLRRVMICGQRTGLSTVELPKQAIVVTSNVGADILEIDVKLVDPIHIAYRVCWPGTNCGGEENENAPYNETSKETENIVIHSTVDPEDYITVKRYRQITFDSKQGPLTLRMANMNE